MFRNQPHKHLRSRSPQTNVSYTVTQLANAPILLSQRTIPKMATLACHFSNVPNPLLHTLTTKEIPGCSKIKSTIATWLVNHFKLSSWLLWVKLRTIPLLVRPQSTRPPGEISEILPHLGRQRLREKTKEEEGRIGVCMLVCLNVFVCEFAVLHADLISVSIQRHETEGEKKKGKNHDRSSDI